MTWPRGREGGTLDACPGSTHRRAGRPRPGRPARGPARAGGYGTATLELRVAASPRTIYEIGSVSKQFTAEAVMLLAEEGRIDLDERARRYRVERADRDVFLTFFLAGDESVARYFVVDRALQP
jgi:hypothetical protein